MPFQNGNPRTSPEPFLTGFMVGKDQREVWARLVAPFELSDGSCLFSDDGGHKIWHIWYKG